MKNNLFLFLILSILALVGCTSPTGSTTTTTGSTTTTTGSTSTTGSTTTVKAGKLSILPISTGSSAARSVVGAANLSPADHALVAKLAASGLKDYTPSLSPVGAGVVARTVDTNAGNALGSLTVGSSGYTLFILQNDGTAPLYDVILTVSNTTTPSETNDFTIVPGTLATLNTSGSSSFEPLVTLNIQHGNIISNGEPLAGQYNYISSGAQVATVKIYAWNTSNPSAHTLTAATTGSGADVELDATLNLQVILAAWHVVPTSSLTFEIGSYTGQGVYTGSNSSTTSQAITISNTGNVALSVVVAGVTGTTSVPVGTTNLQLVAPNWGSPQISITPSGGTVFDNTAHPVLGDTLWDPLANNGQGEGLPFIPGTNTVTLIF